MKGDMKVLIVDDEYFVRSFLERVFELFGYGYRSAQNVEEALRLMEKETFDLLVTDFDMPGGNGKHLIDRGASMGYLPGSVLVCSASLPEDIVRHFDRSGIRYINKPFRIEELKRAVASVMPQHGGLIVPAEVVQSTAPFGNIA